MDLFSPTDSSLSNCYLQYTSLFRQEHLTVTPARALASGPPGGTGDNSMADTFRAPPRPLPYDDPRCSPLYRGKRPVAGFSKASSHCHEESEPLRRSPSGSDAEPAWAAADEPDGPDGGPGWSKPCPSELPLKQWPSEVAYVFPSFEDEDVCPTCLEGAPLLKSLLIVSSMHNQLCPWLAAQIRLVLCKFLPKMEGCLMIGEADLKGRGGGFYFFIFFIFFLSCCWLPLFTWMFMCWVQSILQRTRGSSCSALTISTLAVYMSGWRGARPARSVER